jgi:hypothetical protein
MDKDERMTAAASEILLLPPAERPTDELAEFKALVLDSVTSPHSRRAYDKALDDFLA